jgi:dephospho-CoA kinase
MILVGLTGGIGSGKSTVSSLLRAKGAVIIDADAITRELQEPGQPLLKALAERFGDDIIGASGELLRQELANKVFGDAEAVKDLNRIVHPAVGAEMSRRLEEQRGTDNIVVLDIPLLVENPREGLGGVIVVDVDPELAIGRLVDQRGMQEPDARARIGRQVSREERRAIADWVLDNSGTPEELADQVDRMWVWVRSLPAAGPDAGRQAPRTDKGA